MSGPLEPDREQLERFVNALFMHASEGGTVSIRAFFDDKLPRDPGGPTKSVPSG